MSAFSAKQIISQNPSCIHFDSGTFGSFVLGTPSASKFKLLSNYWQSTDLNLFCRVSCQYIVQIAVAAIRRAKVLSVASIHAVIYIVAGIFDVINHTADTFMPKYSFLCWISKPAWIMEIRCARYNQNRNSTCDTRGKRGNKPEYRHVFEFAYDPGEWSSLYLQNYFRLQRTSCPTFEAS